MKPTTLVLLSLALAAGARAQDVRAAVQAALGPDAAGDWEQPAVWLSTQALDQELGDSFLKTQVGLGIVLPHQDVPAPPSSTVTTTACEEKSCSPTRGCNSNCKDDCTREVKLFGRKIGDVVDPACLVACQTGKVLCEGAKKAEHDLCEINKTLYLGVCGKKLGTIALTEVSADANAALTSLQLTTDLGRRRAALSGELGGKATVLGHINFQPEPLVVPFALCAVFDGWLPPQNVDIRTEGVRLEGALELAQAEPQGSDVKVVLKLDPIDVNATVVGNPIIDVVANNPLNFVTCPGLSLVGVVIDGFKREYDFPTRVALPQPPPIVLGTIGIDPGLLPGLVPQETNAASLSFRRSE